LNWKKRFEFIFIFRVCFVLEKIPFDRTLKTEPDQESASSSTTVSNQPRKKRKLRSDRKASKTSDDTASACSDDLDLTSNWWNAFVDASCEHDMDLSGKMVILGELLSKCYDCGDKLLLFSNCLLTLNFIEKYLQYWSKTSTLLSTKKTLQWLPMVDYCRIDGSTDGYQRRKHINNFNDPNNTRMRLFLISTRAGGIGINLTGANRVVIFNASWNVSFNFCCSFS
jgi:transcriptional regulator ATRX